MSKHCLVTGGTGFIGSALVKKLLKEGYRVRIIDNNSRGNLRRVKDIKKDIEFIKADIRDLNSVSKTCRGIDTVIHLADVNGTEFFYTKPDLVLDVGVRGMLTVLDACIKNKVENLIVASSSETYQNPPIVPTPENVRLIIPDPLNPRYSYAGAKIIKEIMTINYGRKYFKRAIIFRPHNVYGPDMGWEHVIPQFVLRMKTLSEKNKSKIVKFPIQGTGKETRSFCFIDDFIDGLTKIIKRGKHLEIYHIGTTEEVSIKKLAAEVAKYFDRKVDLIQGTLAPGGTPRRCPDISKLRQLGYNPRISLAEGIEFTAEWYIRNTHLETR